MKKLLVSYLVGIALLVVLLAWVAPSALAQGWEVDNVNREITAFHEYAPQSTLNLKGILQINGVRVTATAAELNAAAGGTVLVGGTIAGTYTGNPTFNGNVAVGTNLTAGGSITSGGSLTVRGATINATDMTDTNTTFSVVVTGANRGRVQAWKDVLIGYGNAAGTGIAVYDDTTANFTVSKEGNAVIKGTTTLATSLNGVLKATSGVVGAASAGTDYLAPNAVTVTNVIVGVGDITNTIIVTGGQIVSWTVAGP